jgi:hypothetical protein
MSAGDFYYAINATFRFIHDTWGKEALIDYWTSMANEYHAEVADRFREGGLEEVERYWADYFANEPGGDVSVSLTDKGVEIDVRDCPAIRWLKDGEREIVPYYCEHCHYVSTAIVEQADMAFRLDGGGGTCFQLFSVKGDGPS